MPDREIFEYAVIRVVPKVEREEFINVGVILMSQKKGFLNLKYHIDEARLQCFSKDIDASVVEDYLKAWKVVCIGTKIGNGIETLDLHLRFRWLTANRSTIIQCSSVHPGLCDDPEKKLGGLFKKFVL